MDLISLLLFILFLMIALTFSVVGLIASVIRNIFGRNKT